MSQDIALTSEQIDHFTTRGYLVGDAVFSSDEVAAMAAAYDQCLADLRRTDRLKNISPDQRDGGNPTEFYQIRCAHLAHPLFDELIRDARVLDRVEQLIGPNIKLAVCQGLYKPPRTGGEIPWHQDDFTLRASKENAVVTCWVAIDDATVDNGCMWVIPGAHTQLWEHDKTEMGSWMTDPEEGRATPMELKAGQLTFHHGSAPHRTLANTTDHPRRALAIHYMDATARLLGGNYETEPPENRPVVRGTAT